jgi:hypothetical protein
MKEVNKEDLPPEQQYELEAAFGKDADSVVRLEEDDLGDPVETPEYPIRHVLEEGDWLTIQHKAGNVTTGPVTDVDHLWVKIDPKNRTTTSSVMYGDLKRYKDDERGVVNELIDINGEPADRVIDRRIENEVDERWA